jgi:hypothetical protein
MEILLLFPLFYYNYKTSNKKKSRQGKEETRTIRILQREIPCEMLLQKEKQTGAETTNFRKNFAKNGVL